MSLYRMLPLVALLCVAGGCTSKPVVLNESEQGVAVRYNPSTVTAAEATAAAQAACAKYGRNAVQQGTGITGEILATFSCVK
jgi:hypothetical protein